ncbi:MAG: carbon starvation protein A [Planctomycetota bacterium]|nr:MAG: carbon starvation protein A [Planctomycetota bacterium]
MNAMPILIGVLCILAIAYRYYSAFLAARVAVLDDLRQTPAHTLNDGQNYHPTNKWVLFGHHFAAISGAGPLIGPVLSIQFGYLPGLIWIVVGVCLAGAVQDMLVLAASVRNNGRSLAEIARAEVGNVGGTVASIAILFVVIIALSGLGIVVVKALGGEEIKLAEKTQIVLPEGHAGTPGQIEGRTTITIPEGSQMVYPNGSKVPRSESFTLIAPPGKDGKEPQLWTNDEAARTVTLPAGITQIVPGSSWGTFTIACTVPIALLVGLYMYVFRKGKVVEASILGALATLAVTVIGNWIPGSAWEPYFSLTKHQTILAICGYGFIASVLPVWLLLCPRDYLSSFLKIGTVILLIVAVIVANPKMEAPAINQFFKNGGGPYFNGAIFPFCFICVMCGAVSGFHALVASGTTPKMVNKEGDIRLIGYGAMLIEGIVGIVALIAAASLPAGDYWAVNIDLSKVEQYASTLEKMNATSDNLPMLEQQVGGESLRGRTGGAVTLALGMSKILTDATAKVSGGRVDINSLIKYWYHFAIMFEALFILTTIDTGTRIARFLLQEVMGKLYAPFGKTDWLPGAIISTGLVTLGWGTLIWTGSIDTIWPMFGIANQMLAAIALCIVSVWALNNGRGKFALLTLIPMVFVIVTTTTAGYQMVTGRFLTDFKTGYETGNYAMTIKGGLNIFFTVFMIASLVVLITESILRRMRGKQTGDAAPR